MGQLASEDMLLFKEKINYKFAGSGELAYTRSWGWTSDLLPYTNCDYVGGFDPHIDANAYNHVKYITHLTILAAVDKMTSANGGLDVVEGSHLMTVPLGEDRCIEPDWVKSHKWTPCELQAGMYLYKLPGYHG